MVADTAKDESTGDDLALICGYRADTPTLVGLETVLDDLHGLDPLLSEDRNGRDPETEPHDARLAGRLARGELAQDLDVALHDVRGGFELGFACRVELELGGIHDHVGPGELTELL